MPIRFGELLRQFRRRNRKTLGDVARLLDLSVVYLSDIERGNRKPFNKERVVRICEFLNEEPDELLEAADRELGFIEYDISKGSELEVNVVGGLVTGLARGGVSEEKLLQIQKILKDGGER